MYRKLVFVLLLALLPAWPAMADTTITYQGRLDQHGEPASGSFDATFRLFTADTAGTQAGTTLQQDVLVEDGLFQADLDFGAQSYEAPLWLEITVDGMTLSPRQRIAAAPFALRALSSATCPGCNDAVVAALDALAARIETLEAGNAALLTNVGMLQNDLVAANDVIDTLQNDLVAANDVIDTLQDKTAAISASGTDLFIDGVNLYVRSGSGSTEGAINGVGNLIIGYNEQSAVPVARTGSHNLILGRLNGYSSHGGIVAGLSSVVSAPHAKVLAGDSNVASAAGAVVIGGLDNEATAARAIVVGGWRNVAAGLDSAVLGGDSNTTQVSDSTIGGGLGQTAATNARMRAQGSVVP